MPAFKFNLFCDMSCVSSCTQQWYYGSHFMLNLTSPLVMNRLDERSFVVSAMLCVIDY